MRLPARVLSTFVVALAMGGCAVGRQHAYHNGSPRLSVRGSSLVALAVQDQRAEVLSGAKRSTWVGYQRGGFGNPFDVTTVSGQSLASDFATSIRHGLIRAGYRVIPVALGGEAAASYIQDAFRKTGAQRGLLVQIQVWKSDTYQNTGLEYRVTARVVDPNGQELGRATIAGDDALGGSFLDPAGHAEEAVPHAFNHNMELLLDDPSILRALAPPPPAAAPPAAEPPDEVIKKTDS